MHQTMPQEVAIPTGQADLNGLLTVPPETRGMVVFAHGSGSSRFSPRNQAVAASLQDAGFGTLLFDLLTADEAMIDARTREHRFDVPLLARRLVEVTDWLRTQETTQALPLGYFGASTGAAAAMVAAADRPDAISAVVSRGGRVDLAGDALPQVKAPALMIVGGLDDVVIDMNRQAQSQMQAVNELVIVEGATHLFEEPGKMDEVTRLAGDWFRRHVGT